MACPLSTFDSWQATAQGIWPVYEITAKDYSAVNRLLKGERGLYLIGHTFMHLAVKRQSAWPVETAKPLPTFGLKRVYKTGLWACDMVTGKEHKTRRAIVPKWSWAKVSRQLDVMVCDEVHNASNKDTATFKALRMIKPKRLRLGMSATPAGDKFSGIWAVTRWLWPDLIDNSFWRWAARYAEFEFSPYSATGKKILGEKNPGEFVASLPCYFREMPPKVAVHTYRARVSLTVEQVKQYEEMREKSITWLAENPLVADLPIVQKVRLRQMLLGEVTFNAAGEVDFAADAKSTKAEACLKIIEREQGQRIMFYVDSRRYAEYLARRLQDAGYAAEAWTGGQSKEERKAIKERFIEGTTRYIVGTISKALGEGTDGLQEVCSVEVWINQAFSSVLVEQTKGRLNRRGQTADHITRYELYVADSADDEDFVRSATKELRRTQELTTL